MNSLFLFHQQLTLHYCQTWRRVQDKETEDHRLPSARRLFFHCFAYRLPPPSLLLLPLFLHPPRRLECLCSRPLLPLHRTPSCESSRICSLGNASGYKVAVSLFLFHSHDAPKWLSRLSHTQFATF